MNSISENRKRTLFLAQFSMLLAIEAIFCFTPLGSIPAIGPISATLAHIPVIITAIILGTGAGTAMGLFAGIFSFIVWTFYPPNPVIAFCFSPFFVAGEHNVTGSIWSIFICIVPRILIGTVAGLSFKLFKKIFHGNKRKDVLAYGLSGLLGSMTNTVLVLGFMYLIFVDKLKIALSVIPNFDGTAYGVFLALGGVFLTNGIPEAVLGTITGYAVCKPIRKYLKLD